MSLSNPWFLLALLATFGLFHLELIATLLNLSALKPEPPERLRATVSDTDHERALEYSRVSASFDITERSVSLAVLVGFWWTGGFGWLERLIAGWHFSPLGHGLAVIGMAWLLGNLLSLPFQIYDTFVLERRFGFNKTTWPTFIMDRVKALLLAAALGLPLVALLLWMFDRFELAALYGWLAVSAFSLVMSFVAPRLIMPLFFKFQPLADEELRGRIVALSRKLNFPVADVSVVDGSRRSTKANAFFTGFGRTRRIALFDTLLAGHTHDEILAVLAHEIGHGRLRHVPKHISLSLALSAVMFALLHFGVHDARLCAAFGVAPASTAWSLVFFSIVYEPLGAMLALFGGQLSRKFEFQADAFAREAMNSAGPMADALMKLSRDHLTHLTPHPFYVFLHYSHPPVLQRLQALEES